MHEEDYYKALFEVVSESLRKELNRKKEFEYKHSKILLKSVGPIHIEKVKNEIKLHKMFSGQPCQIFVEGSLRVEQLDDKFSRTKDYKFWIQEVIFRFNQSGERFEVIKIEKFIIL